MEALRRMDHRKLRVPVEERRREREPEIDNFSNKSTFSAILVKILPNRGLSIEISQSKRTRCEVVKSRTLILNTIIGLAILAAISLIVSRFDDRDPSHASAHTSEAKESKQASSGDFAVEQFAVSASKP